MSINLLQQGITAVKEGNKTKARSILSQVVQADPKNGQAWLWLSSVVETDEQRIQCLENVLKVNPNDQVAQRGLERLRKIRAGTAKTVCPQCGFEDAGNFCSNCGAVLPVADETQLASREETTEQLGVIHITQEAEFSVLHKQIDNLRRRLQELREQTNYRWMIILGSLLSAGFIYYRLIGSKESAFVVCGSGLVGFSLLFLGAGAWLSRYVQIAQGKKKLAVLEEQYDLPLQVRRELLSSIASGDLDKLTFIQPYLLKYDADVSIGNLSPIHLGFKPQKNEVCYFQATNASLARLRRRSVTQKVGGGYRIGRYYVPVEKRRVSLLELEPLDMGIVAITNQRILFLGQTKKLTLKFDKILQTEVFFDALAVTKEGRQSADYLTGIDGELAQAIVAGFSQHWQ